MRKLLCILVLFWANITFADVLIENFDAGLPDNATLFGNALAQNERIELTQEVGSQIGGLAFDEIDAAPVSAFEALFDFQAGEIAGGADGFSFNFVSLGNIGAFDEEGADTGIAIGFDTFQNEGQSNDNQVTLRFNDVLLAEVDVTGILDLNDTQIHSSRVQLLDTGEISVFITPNSGEETLVLNDAIGDFVPFRGQFNFGARTGGEADLHAIDNVNITTTAVPEPSTYFLLFVLSLFGMMRYKKISTAKILSKV